jgi:hypothetical protein
MSSCSLMHRVFPPSKPPDGGYPPSFRFVVGGTQLRGSWYLSAVVRLQGFSSHSPAIPPPPPSAVTQDGDHQPLGGEKQVGLQSWSRPQPRGCSSSSPGWGARRAGALPPARAGGPPLLPASGGGKHPPALRRRRPPAMPGKANCCCLARMQHSALFLAFEARTAARTCRCAWERPALWL